MMRCDRAEEFFSDYLERTLDRPMLVALEAHLSDCAACRGEIETLRASFRALDTLPEVEPPADGVWLVMARLREERARQYEAERARPVSFLEWLRSLNPLSVGMGAGLATLVIGGTILLTRVPGQVQATFGPGLSAPTPARTVETAAQVSYGQVSAAGQQVNVQLASEVDLPDAQIQVLGASVPFNWEGQGKLARGASLTLPAIELPRTASFHVVVSSPALGKQYRHLVVAAVGERKTEAVTLFLTGVPLEEALRQLAPYFAQPLVVDGAIEGQVSLQVDGQSARSCLETLAQQVGAIVQAQGGAYHLKRPPHP
jgi:hypothetical protein